WNLKSIVAGFSTSNLDEAQISPENVIPGFDMGINTPSPIDHTEKNRQQMLHELGLNPNLLAYLKQVHGNHVIEATNPGLLGEADGLITTQSNLALGILVADCAAVLIADQDQKVIGAFHAGWRGAVGGILNNGIKQMKNLGGKEFSAWISPCIGLTAFEVGDEVAAQFPAKFVHTQGFSKPHIDLKSFVIENLQNLGLKRDRIFADERCTFENTEFYSYRRQGKQSGRMLAVISMIP
ncbi:MAG TPA: peptidoglycan editing factor PgeF, partial [Bacteroidetes bacterium]|nr:peptidoglycan editing factor PgeF [Bacteroidota bacterium]